MGGSSGILVKLNIIIEWAIAYPFVGTRLLPNQSYFRWSLEYFEAKKRYRDVSHTVEQNVEIIELLCLTYGSMKMTS